MAVEIDIRIENIRKSADDLAALARKIRNYKLGVNISKSKGSVASQTMELKEALEKAAENMAVLVEKTSQTAYQAADTFNAMDEGMKY